MHINTFSNSICFVITNSTIIIYCNVLKTEESSNAFQKIDNFFGCIYFVIDGINHHLRVSYSNVYRNRRESSNVFFWVHNLVMDGVNHNLGVLFNDNHFEIF